jgi:hypothetical protein
MKRVKANVVLLLCMALSLGPVAAAMAGEPYKAKAMPYEG